MKTTKLCRECGQPVPSDALLGLCPQCMMKAGLPASSRPTIAVAPDAFVESAETETKAFIPGTKLGYIGDYELLEEIARGGMGVVYKARQSSLKRIVAVKMIRSGELASEVEVRRFRSEAEAAAQLQHPNIVAIHEIGEHQGQHYFSMDFVEGKNLAQVANGKPVAARLAAEWLKTIAGAVQFAHQRGVLHRDLKPQNIMLDMAGRTRVMDFGLAKTLGGDTALTNTGMVMGSPSYMSPEQALGRNDLVGPASDVYSLGAILYELITGRPPFCGKSVMDTMSQVVNDEPPPPRSLNSGAPVDLESICLKCLEKDPARRYPTARELEADLGRYLAGEPVLARPANALRRTMSWFRRHRWVFSAAVSALILTLAGLAYGFWEQTRLMAWHNAHPDVVRVPGERGSEFIFSPQNCALMLVGVSLFAFTRLVLKTFPAGLQFASRFVQTRVPVLAAVFAAGPLLWNLFLIALGLNLAAEVVHEFVWQGEFPFLFTNGILLFLILYTGVAGLMRIVREQTRIPVEPRPKDNPTQSTQVWMLLGIIILVSCLWMLSVPQPFSRSNLSQLGCGLVVVVSMRFGLFLLICGWPGAFGADSSRVAESQKAFLGMPRWIGFLTRFAIACLALLILTVDFLFTLLVLGTANPNPAATHGRGFFICGMLVGGMLIYLVRKKRTPTEPCPEDKPAPLSPEQLVPIHEAIFAGRTNDAFKLYHAANGEKATLKIADYKNLMQMEVELKLAHPEKFSAGMLDQATKRANRRAWLWWGFILLVGLWMLFLPQALSGSELYFLGFGFVWGVIIRVVASVGVAGWKKMYRGMRRGIKWGAWFLITMFTIVVVDIIFELIAHPSGALDPLFQSLVCGLLAGWLLVHLWLKKQKRP